jgi:16S rRNA (guanine527-N7)-methyltransferase
VPHHTASSSTPVSSGDKLAAAIHSGATSLGLSLDARSINLLACYLTLLSKWNRVYNLTGIREAPAMVAPHLLDSLSAHGYTRGPRVLDVGSGAGLPGIPLAIANPDLYVVLLDSSAKKTRFIQQALIELRLHNARVERNRIESYRPQAGFDTVICRSFAPVADFVAAASHACLPAGRMLAMKSRLTGTEQQHVRAMRSRVRIYKLKVPRIEGERQLIEISKA